MGERNVGIKNIFKGIFAAYGIPTAMFGIDVVLNWVLWLQTWSLERWLDPFNDHTQWKYSESEDEKFKCERENGKVKKEMKKQKEFELYMYVL